MKRILILFIILLFQNSCLLSQNVINKSVLDSNTTLVNKSGILKDYFLCKCIILGFEKDSLLQHDHTTSVLAELADYDYKALSKLDNLAENYLKKIPISEYTGKKGILGKCIEYYKSKDLDLFINGINK